MLTCPDYIEKANIKDPQIRFTWDDWNVEAAEEPLDPALLKRLEGMSQRANIAFAIASAEWVAFRFEDLLVDVTPFDYLEAAWAQLVDFRYGFIWWQPVTDENWRGPVKGPVRAALSRVMGTIRFVENDEPPAPRVVRACNLAMHVQPRPEPFQKWRDSILERLESLYPIDSNETLGEVVPRKAMDPTFDFNIDQTEALVNEFLASLDPDDNSFLKSPEALSEEGFEGIPYHFDLKKDRELRYQW